MDSIRGTLNAITKLDKLPNGLNASNNYGSRILYISRKKYDFCEYKKILDQIMKREELIELFEKYSDLINMGTSDDAPGNDWIDAAEKELLVSFPADYKWFLNNYGGGDICGEEIYSIYCLPFNEAVGGDIVYQNMIANNNLETGKIALSNTDSGEEFFFDTNDMEKVYISIGNNRQLYANDFLEYLQKRLFSYV